MFVSLLISLNQRIPIPVVFSAMKCKLNIKKEKHLLNSCDLPYTSISFLVMHLKHYLKKCGGVKCRKFHNWKVQYLEEMRQIIRYCLFYWHQPHLNEEPMNTLGCLDSSVSFRIQENRSVHSVCRCASLYHGKVPWTNSNLTRKWEFNFCCSNVINTT